MRAEARGLSGMLTASMPTPRRKSRASISLADVGSLGRNDFDHGDELAARPACAREERSSSGLTTRQWRGRRASHLERRGAGLAHAQRHFMT